MSDEDEIRVVKARFEELQERLPIAYKAYGGTPEFGQLEREYFETRDRYHALVSQAGRGWERQHRHEQRRDRPRRDARGAIGGLLFLGATIGAIIWYVAGIVAFFRVYETPRAYWGFMPGSAAGLTWWDRAPNGALNVKWLAAMLGLSFLGTTGEKLLGIRRG